MKRKKYSASQKVKILREHLEEGLRVSEISEKYNLHPNQFYRWKKELFEGALETFSQKGKRENKSQARQETQLKAKLSHKDGVIVELLEENLRLKKTNGEI